MRASWAPDDINFYIAKDVDNAHVTRKGIISLCLVLCPLWPLRELLLLHTLFQETVQHRRRQGLQAIKRLVIARTLRWLYSAYTV